MERRNLTARPRRNLAAQAGRWSAKHRKTAIWGWMPKRLEWLPEVSHETLPEPVPAPVPAP